MIAINLTACSAVLLQPSLGCLCSPASAGRLQFRRLGCTTQYSSRFASSRLLITNINKKPPSRQSHHIRPRYSPKHTPAFRLPFEYLALTLVDPMHLDLITSAPPSSLVSTELTIRKELLPRWIRRRRCSLATAKGTHRNLTRVEDWWECRLRV